MAVYKGCSSSISMRPRSGRYPQRRSCGLQYLVSQPLALSWDTEDLVSLFQSIPNAGGANDTTRPLADRMRPRTLDEYVGQEHLIGPGKPLRVSIERDDSGSIIF